VASTLTRIVRAWGRLGAEQRGAAIASLALFVTMFLPWYTTTVTTSAPSTTGRHAASHLQATETFTAWGAFSFVEAAVLVVAVGVLVLLFQRAEGRAFHLPGGDGWVITMAGIWACFLVVWRAFDKQGVTSHQQVLVSSGIEWGIFAALLAAAGLAYAGVRIRASRRPEPPLPTEDGAVFDGRWTEPSSARAADTPRAAAPAAASVAAPATARRRGRSSWRPAEHPEWSDPAKPVGWLTAARRGPSIDPDPDPEPEADERPDREPAAEARDARGDQLTIRFDGDQE
jgi:hypothetical protein